MPYANVDGVRIFYITAGRGETLTFIHGAIGSHRFWKNQEPLSEKFKVVMFDLPGHGQSDRVKNDVTIKGYVELVFNLLNILGVRRTTLVGHSMGGAISMQVAVDYPEIVEKLILVGTSAKLGVLPSLLSLLKNDYKKAVTENLRQIAFAQNSGDEVFQFSLEEMLKCPPDMGCADFAACNTFDLRDRISEIKAPTLILVGSNDALTPPKWSYYLKDKIVNSQLKIIEGAGHMIMLEKPEEVNSAIFSFLKR